MHPTRILLFFLGCNAAANETSRFLIGNGFEHLEPTFVEQEIEVRQISSLPDHLLIDLGVRTIGARLRLRSAARQWVQVSWLFVCLFSISKTYGSIFLFLLIVSIFVSAKRGRSRC